MVDSNGHGFRATTLASLNKAVAEGRVDIDVIPLLSSINQHPYWATTSSCSGRIQLLAPPVTGDKVGSRVLGKWHRPVESAEVMDAISSWDGQGELHLLVQPLLLHIRCRDLRSAARIRNMGQESGMKFSSIRSIRLNRDGEPIPWGITVELLGTERSEIHLHGLSDDVLRESIPVWIVHANALVSRTVEHIPELIEMLEKGAADR